MANKKAACLLFTKNGEKILLRKSDNNNWNTIYSYVPQEDTTFGYINNLISEVSSKFEYAKWIGKSSVPKQCAKEEASETDWFAATIPDGFEKELSYSGYVIDDYEYKFISTSRLRDTKLPSTIDLCENKAELKLFTSLGVNAINSANYALC